MDNTANAQGENGLREAFDLFKRQSGELVASYEALQGEVARLNRDLARAYQCLEAQLAEREQLLNLLPGAVLVVDTNGRIREGNGQARALFGLDDHENPDWVRLQKDLLVEAGEPGEYVFAASPGDRRLLLTSSECPPPGGTILLFTDVTDNRRHEQDRQRRERLAEMGRMVANLAHQLRTPLATAILYLSQLEQTRPVEGGRQLSRALGRLHRVEELIRDTLRYARIGGQQGSRVDASRVRQAAETDQLPQYRQKNVALGFEWSENLTLPGSLEGWEAVLGNLLANALHFSPAGCAVLVELRERGCELFLRVVDQGPGFDPALGAELFDPFFTTRPDGTGLGLSIVRDYIEELGGTARAENSATGGCVVELRLPAIGTKFA